ncbi:matrixin family metalloprotease [Fodinibius saliphilus]|uniref:matrixin family metalloprotease n=1 Tax=Fodinibius saliphilus TaxID=1920650 RepID=UPI001109841D|nr:matrixin family metalloprotease [Fodinibius saliphilus]
MKHIFAVIFSALFLGSSAYLNAQQTPTVDSALKKSNTAFEKIRKNHSEILPNKYADPFYPYYQNYPQTEPCGKTITYRIANIDIKYNISNSELKQVMRKVESLWEQPIGEDLLQYKKNGEIGIHLIYGGEQHLENDNKFPQHIKIKTLENRIKLIRRSYKRLSKRYKEKSEEMEKALAKYNKAAKRYNRKIEELKKNGGIPSSKKQEIEQIQRMPKQLKDKAINLKQTAESLRQRSNKKSKELDDLLDRRNEMIAEYNSRFGEAQRFNQGQYLVTGNRKRINIYQFSTRAELTILLAHETGHALGLDHVDNPRSIMHIVLTKQNIFDLSLTEEDINALRKRCNNY